jgi:hypothetical protein
MCSAALVAVQLSCEHEAQLLQQVYCSMQYTAGMAALTYVIIYRPVADAVTMTSMPFVPVDVWHWLHDGTGNCSGFPAGMLAGFQGQSAATQPRLREAAPGRTRQAGRAGQGDPGRTILRTMHISTA